MEWIVAIIVSFGVGTLSAIFGVGGGFILVPVLTTILDFPTPIIVGSTVCYVLGPATTAMLYRQTKLLDWRLPLIVAGGLFTGVLLGSNTLNRLANSSSGQGGAESVVLGTYLVLLTTLGFFSLWETERALQFRPVPRGWLKEISIPPIVTLPEWNRQKMSIPVLAWFGVFVGFLSGLLGISGGLLVVPGFLYLFGLPAQATVASSMVVVWIVSAQATLAHALHGNIDLKLVAALLTGGTIGARFGSSLGQRLGSQQLRRNFGILALATAILVGLRLLFAKT
ncbi:sulfite exporter TauE/SafE family protein [Thalassoglobus sp. JC818]|uniref:sulfite exporter TauE/SafE family protein n=1 Tax=Thalassoglobus sp. JC818 TaxID=3232136 RepID=UPI00345AB644